MKTIEIIKSVNKGVIVNWKSNIYEVRKDLDSYIIYCTVNKTCVGLTYKNTSQLIENEKDFYINHKNI